MKLFDKRPLSLILCILLAVFVFFADSGSIIGIFVAIGAAILVFIFTFLFPRLFIDAKKCVRIAAILIIPTVLFSTFYFEHYFKADERFAAETVVINGYVHEIDKQSSTSTDKAIIKSTDINGRPFSEYTLLAYFDKEDSQRLTPGAELKLVGKLSGFTSPQSSYAKGICAKITDIQEMEVTGYRKLSIQNVITDYREWIMRQIVLESEDTYRADFLRHFLWVRRTIFNPV